MRTIKQPFRQGLLFPEVSYPALRTRMIALCGRTSGSYAERECL